MLVSVLFAVSLFAGLASAGKGSDAVEAAEDDEDAVSSDVAKWSVLVYLVADNNLDEYT
ncbi:MAG TPA: hypothetical protein HA364_07325, partial [Thermoplasmata archaeon]|nr:hypothetical protein [Thermoplasmata archaeon]